MGFSHRQVAQKFVEGKRAKGFRMFTHDKVIYSHGEHFPIALDLGHGTYLFNDDHYSQSTSTHQWIVRSALSDCKIVRCTTEEIKTAIRNPGEPVIITKMKEHDNLKGALDNIYDICKADGMVRVPKQKWLDMIRDEKDISIFRSNAKSSNSQRRRAAAGSVYTDKNIKYRNEYLKTLIKLLKDPEVSVISEACSTLVERISEINNAARARVEKALRGIDHKDFGLEYLGLMRIEYPNGNLGIVALFLEEKGGVRFFTNGTYFNLRHSLLTAIDLEENWMRVGEYENMIVTSTVDPEILKNMLGLLVIGDL